MKPTPIYRNLILGMLAVTPLGLIANAQVPSTTAPAESPTVIALDSHPYQNGTFFRMKDGSVRVILANTYEYKSQGATPGTTQSSQEVYVNDKAAPPLATTTMGANYGTIGNVFVVTSVEGYFYKYVGAFTPGLMGGNYFIDKNTNHFVTVNSSGSYYDSGINVSKEGVVTETGFKVMPDSIKVVGGNYYIDTNGALTTIDSRGFFYGFTGTPYVVTLAGGTFFQTKDGTLVTIDSTNGGTKAYTPTSAPRVAGGNYYIGQDGLLYSIDHQGNLFSGVTIPGEPAVKGYNYLIFADGSFRVIAADGSVHDRMVEVSTTNQKSVLTKIDLSNFDKTSVYLPRGVK